MPDDIWNDANAVREYIGATNQWYKIDGIQLKQKPCDRPGRIQRGSLNVRTSTFPHALSDASPPMRWAVRPCF